ncbi:hypothetical protein [Lentzea sp.]|uniref:hypothetical protein n=1 Tax=Lentzea sp. TaxID=56099 RepID=UPI002C5705AB|nr:hypothetical protein [Lentzea sp.]HUQ54628.1 hypothetical protein [Lentzea sp.]
MSFTAQISGASIAAGATAAGAVLCLLAAQPASAVNKSGTTSLLTYGVPGPVDRVRVQAAAGSWTTTPTPRNCP